MEYLFRYLIIASFSVAFLFVAYHILLKKENNFKLSRIYLLFGLMFSLLLPFNNYNIELPEFSFQAETVAENLESNSSDDLAIDAYQSNTDETQQIRTATGQQTQVQTNYFEFLLIIYLIVSSILIVRILFSICQIGWYYLFSEKQKEQGFTIIYITKRSIPFSFFRFIFITKQDINENIREIIEHEKIHAKQIHTIDLLIAELLVAAMWFNPFIWMYKRELQQVHEFLADEGVLNSGVDQLEYQSLLVNQAAEGRLVAVSSNFSYSLIKKRIMMMSKRKNLKTAKRKSLIIIPVLTFLIVGVSLFNSTANASIDRIDYIMLQPKKTAVAKMKIDEKENSSSAELQKHDDVDNKNMALEEKVVKEPIVETQKQSEPQDTVPKNSEKLIAAVSATKMNVLYIGVDNPVSIGVTGANLKDVKVSIDNGVILGEYGNYIVRVNGHGKVVTITVKAGNKIVSETMFRVKRIPDPLAMVGNTRGGTITTEQLIDAKGVRVVLINFDWDMKFEIVSFNISGQKEGGFIQDAKQENGSTFTAEQIEIISKTAVGRKIYIEDIKARGPDGTIRDLGSLTYKIKD